jgi:hypothetical protein
MSLTKVSYEMIDNSTDNVVDFGAVCVGVTDDSVAINNFLAANVNNRYVTFTGNDINVSTGLTTPTASVNTLFDGQNAVISGSGDVFNSDTGEVTIQNLELDGFISAYDNDSTDAKTNLTINGLNAKSMTGVNVRALAPFDLAATNFSKFDGGNSRTIAHSGDTLSQATHNRSVMLANYATNLNGGAGQCIPYISYANSTVMAFNYIKNFGVGSTGEIDAFYTKSPRSIIFGNYAENGTTTSSSKYYFNIKGAERGAGVTEGYGGFMVMNTSIGNNDGANQVQNGEAIVAFNHFENMTTGIEYGTGDCRNNGIVGNYVLNATARPVSFSNTADLSGGGDFVGGFNRYINAGSSVQVATTDNNFDGVTFIGDHLNTTGAAGYSFLGISATISNVALVHPKIELNGSTPIRLENVDGFYVDTPRIQNANSSFAATTMVFDTAVSNGIANNLNRKFTLTGATIADIFTQTLLADMVVEYEYVICGKATDNSKAFTYRTTGSCWYDGTTLRAVSPASTTGAAIDNAGVAVVMTGATVSFSGALLRFRMTAAAGNDWSGFSKLTLTIN